MGLSLFEKSLSPTFRICSELARIRSNTSHAWLTGHGNWLKLSSLMAQLVKNPPAMWETWVRSLGWEDSLEKGKKGYPLQYSCLENSMHCVVCGVTKSQKRLSNFHFTLNHTCIIFDKQSVQTWVDTSHNNEFILITFYFHLSRKLFYFITGWLSQSCLRGVNSVVFQCQVLQCSCSNSSPASSTASGCFHTVSDDAEGSTPPHPPPCRSYIEIWHSLVCTVI